MFYVYVLKSNKDNNCYIGSTTNLKLRFQQHANGEVISTRHRRPLVLIYYEAYLTLEDARTREYRLKKKSQAYDQLLKRIYNSKQH